MPTASKFAAPIALAGTLASAGIGVSSAESAPAGAKGIVFAGTPSPSQANAAMATKGVALVATNGFRDCGNQQFCGGYFQMIFSRAGVSTIRMIVASMIRATIIP
ncbi:hypothetical protein ACWZHB_11550 [Nocardia sp. FBN12]|uniref:hypothetical protein n=1 Tax=Nocardia sp. FBN12 TaxID=3419766 RepID=UPI003D03CBE8